jgi:hypothetical protein
MFAADVLEGKLLDRFDVAAFEVIGDAAVALLHGIVRDQAIKETIT